jgi:hypothetical protein
MTSLVGEEAILIPLKCYKGKNFNVRQIKLSHLGPFKVGVPKMNV